jgi:hypothetical protein
MGRPASAGAELLYVGNTAKKATIRSQPAIDSEQVINRVKETADGMAAGEFIATENELCRNCNVRDSCPVMLDGRSVVEP